jgi:molybdopterin synthase catalytic subunit
MPPNLLATSTSTLDGVSPLPPVVRLVDIRDTALSADEVLTAVSDAAAGGVTLFLGAVRDHDENKSVTGLEYSAHPTAMALLADVAEEVAREYDVLAVAAVHRVGRLQIGDAAVVVATAAAHRDEAFEASRALIDRLKQRVPIWKHQLFADGTDEWVGTP